MREIKVKIPDYLTIGQYQELTDTGKMDSLDKMLYIITTLTEYDEKEIKSWPVKTIAEVANSLMDVTGAPNEFYPIVKIKDQVYGYAQLSKSSFGEYVDLENLLKEPITNLHEIAAMLYRPIKKHRFSSFSFIRKYGIDAANNKVTDPFKWYTVEKYDSELREERSEMMKDFPVQLILGAMGFTSLTGTLSINDTLYSENKITEREMKSQEKRVMELLSHNIGGGLAHFTT